MTWITGIQGNKAKPSHHIVRFAAESLDHQEQTVIVTAVLVDKITHDLPTASTFGTQNWEVTRHLALVDPTFYQPGRIDALLGMDVLFDILINEGEPRAIGTIFVWAIAGPYSGETNKPNNNISLHVVCDQGEDLNALLRSFWESEELYLKSEPLLTTDEQWAVKTFKESVTRTSEGRYQVAIPRKREALPLGESRAQALAFY